MKRSNILMTVAALALISTGAMAAEGNSNTDGTHNASNTQTDTNMGVNANRDISNDAAADVNVNASTEAEMSDTSNDINTNSDINDTAAAAAEDDPMTSYSDGHRPSASASVEANTATTASVDASTVQSVQSELRDEGHKVSVDGVLGPKTASALRDFQRAKGLPVTGTINSETLAALDIKR